MRRALLRVTSAFGAYLLLEWLFAYMTSAEGLVSPLGAPNAWVIAIGAAYLSLRIVVRLVLPGALVFAVVNRRHGPWLGPASVSVRR